MVRFKCETTSMTTGSLMGSETK